MYKLFTVLLLISIKSYSQECRYDKNEIDEFTKKKVIALRQTRIFSHRGLSNRFIDAKISQDGYLKYLTLILTEVGGGKLDCFDKNDVFYIKQKNDSITILKNVVIECGNYQSAPQGYYYILYFNLLDTKIELLKSSPIVKIRLRSFEGEVKEGTQNYFIDNLKCLEN
jgi:hypothetical protein